MEVARRKVNDGFWQSYGITPEQLRLPDSVQHGHRDRVPGGRGVSGALRSPRVGGRPCAGVRTDQAAHAVCRRHRKRPDEDDAHRLGQARRSALVYHQAIQDFSFGQILRSVAHEVLKRCNILAGLAIVENAYDETACIAGVAPDEFELREPELLRQARQWLPKLPFDRADVLLIDEIGKDVSGAGLDTNVVGRKHVEHAARDDEFPKIKYIVVRGLTQETHRNATGIGLVEFCRSQICCGKWTCTPPASTV